MIEPMLTDLAEAVRRTSASEQLAARVAGQAHRPVLLCTLHIGGANWKSRATPTDVPTPSGQRRCRIYPDHCCKLQAEAIRGCNLVQIAAITKVARQPSRIGRQRPPGASKSRASTWTRVYEPQYARCGENFLRTKQAHTNTRPMPPSGCMDATCSRLSPRSHDVGGLLEVECEG